MHHNIQQSPILITPHGLPPPLPQLTPSTTYLTPDQHPPPLQAVHKRLSTMTSMSYYTTSLTIRPSSSWCMWRSTCTISVPYTKAAPPSAPRPAINYSVALTSSSAPTTWHNTPDRSQIVLRKSSTVVKHGPTRKLCLDSWSIFYITSSPSHPHFKKVLTLFHSPQLRASKRRLHHLILML